MIIQRLSGRRTCKQCGAIYHITNIPPKEEGKCDKCEAELFQRDDDQEKAILNRLEVYKKQTFPLIDFYKEKGIIADINASTTPDEISKDCVKALS
ncbi:adenylate kinase family protein [Nanoarchaeota archaeon]